MLSAISEDVDPYLGDHDMTVSVPGEQSHGHLTRLRVGRRGLKEPALNYDGPLTWSGGPSLIPITCVESGSCSPSTKSCQIGLPQLLSDV